MAKAELGTKRVDPETGKKFYDLNKDPIVSPFTGVSYPRSFFETGPAAKARLANVKDDEEEDEVEDEAVKGAEFVSLEEADEEAAGGKVVVEGDDDDDVEIADDEADDVFIEDEEEDGDDVTDIIGGVEDEES